MGTRPSGKCHCQEFDAISAPSGSQGWLKPQVHPMLTGEAKSHWACVVLENQGSEICKADHADNSLIVVPSWA